MGSSGIVGIVGSLRGGSVHGLLARTAAARRDDLTLFDTASLPLYDGDAEAAGPPAAALALHEAVAGAAGVVFFSPEYNSSFPAVTKNAIDWMSRPPRSYEGRAVTMITTSPGGRAGLGVREHFATIMGFQPVRLFDTLGLARYGDRLDASGELDDDTMAEVDEFLGRFAEFARSAGDVGVD